MAVTRDRFEQGLTYEQFKAQMTRNQERFEANGRQLELDPEDLAAFKDLPQALNVLVLAEDWCGDVIDNLPILGRIAEESGKLRVRVFLRDQNADLMDLYLKDGQFRSIPVFAFFDENFRELGRFIERPESVSGRRAALRRELSRQHPDLGSPDVSFSQLPDDARTKLLGLMAAAREETKAQDNREVVRSLRAIVEPVRA